jgi:hypothetical protein
LKQALLLFFVFSLILSEGMAQSPDRIRVIGRISDGTGDPVPYAHVLIKQRAEGTVAGINGSFEMHAFPGDTLFFSAISFHPALYSVPAGFIRSEITLDVVMVHDTVALKEVVVRPWPATFEQLRNAVLDYQPVDPLASLDLRLPSKAEMKMLFLATGYVSGQVRLYSGSGPVSLLYDRLSRESKQKQAFTASMDREKAGRKYNRELIARVTGMNNEEDIGKFIEFCALEIPFILNSTDYELYSAILTCFRDFRGPGTDTVTD